MTKAGSMPDYLYRPTNTSIPRIKTCSSIRARLFNETYFRATEPGGNGNKLSLGIVQIGETVNNTSNAPKGVLYITNHVNQFEDSVSISNPSSKLKMTYFDISGLNFNESISVIVVSPSQIAITNTISLQIRNFGNPEPVTTDQGVHPMRYAFTLRENVTFCIDIKESILEVGDIITITPRIEKYNLSWVMKLEPVSSGEGGIQFEPHYGWSIEALRDSITGDKVTPGSKWVEMLPRAYDRPSVISREDEEGEESDVIFSPSTDGENPRNLGSDFQDSGYDYWVLNSFPETYLHGGDGLPHTPDYEITGIIRSIIHLNYGERYYGDLGEVNLIYEWAGMDNLNGMWCNLFR